MYRSRRRDLRRDRRKRARARVASTLALLVVLAGLGLVAYALLGEGSPLSKAVSNATNDEDIADSAPAETTLKLTIPAMERVSNLNVYDTPWDDETALDAGAQHVQGTGFPWEEESNTYIAGHRLGYLGTDSYLVFYDLDKLEEGDEVFLTDSNGTRYTYEVFKNFVADPYDWSVTEPISGKNIVTLQTCTLPDYTERVIVQAELTKVEKGQGVEPDQDEPDQDEPGQDEPDQYGPAQYEPLPVEQAQYEPAPVEQAPIGPGPVEPGQEAVPLQEVPAPVSPTPIGGGAPAEPVPTG
jgi:sortase A